MLLGLDNKVLIMKDLAAPCSLDRGSVSMLAAFRIQIDLTARAIVHRRTGGTQFLVLWLSWFRVFGSFSFVSVLAHGISDPD